MFPRGDIYGSTNFGCFHDENRDRMCCAWRISRRSQTEHEYRIPGGILLSASFNPPSHNVQASLITIEIYIFKYTIPDYNLVILFFYKEFIYIYILILYRKTK